MQEKLDALWEETIKINNLYFKKNGLMPIFGGGKIYKPKIMFVFINPTHKNTSSDPDWTGPRFPFIGTKQVWRVFYKSGLFDSSLLKIIENGDWTENFANDVLKFLQIKSFYLTNIVKSTGEDSSLPEAKKVNLFLPLLKKEIYLVQPEYIVTFGLIPFESLTGRKIKLGEYYKKFTKTGKLQFYNIENEKAKIIPCYFPVGRGNPKRAIEILKAINLL